jgi:7-cyano-7-deazaguanine synthase in queuosine biosynthesis
MNEVLLFSGGIDSYVAWHYLKKPKTVYFDLGTPYSSREAQAVLQLVPNTVIDRSLVLGDRQAGINAYIPYRNLFLAMLASKYGDKIWIAGLKDDMVSDKTPAAFFAMESCLNFIDKKKVVIDSPFWNTTKSQVVEWYINQALDKNELLKTISCYNDKEQTNYCGTCPSCFRKWNALRENGIDIEFYNPKLMQEYIQSAENLKYDPERNLSIVKCCSNYTCKRIFHFDIDGVITNETEGWDYAARTPNTEVIDKIKELAKGGNRIVFYTARFSCDREVTEQWLAKHEIQYSNIIFDKPGYDYFVDDKAYNSIHELFKNKGAV